MHGFLKVRSFKRELLEFTNEANKSLKIVMVRNLANTFLNHGGTETRRKTKENLRAPVSQW